MNLYGWLIEGENPTATLLDVTAGITLALMLALPVALEKRHKATHKKPHSTHSHKASTYNRIPDSDQHPSEHQHRSQEQEYWRWQSQSERKNGSFGKAALVISAIALIGAIWSAVESHRQVAASQTANKMNAESGRAWIAQGFAVVSGPVEDGKPISVSVFYSNVGREPATSTLNTASLETILASEAGNLPDWENPVTNGCSLIKNHEGGSVVFPSISGNNSSIATWAAEDAKIRLWRNGIRYNPGSDFKAASNIASGRYILMVSGCFTYNTASSNHHTRFCIYLLPNSDKPITQWLFRDCRNGNEAT